MYFYDLVFDGNKIVFPEYLVGQIVVLDADFIVDTIILDESNYGKLFWGIYSISNEYIFSIYKSKVIRKYIKKRRLFVDVEIKNLPPKSEVQFKHDEIFVHKDGIIIITTSNDILVSDMGFCDIKYIKNICMGMQHMQIAEDKNFLYIPIEKTIFRLSKNDLKVSVYAQFDQYVDVLFRNRNSLWILTNDAQLINLNSMQQSFKLDANIHFYGDREIGQIYNYINAFCYQEMVLFVPCYCDNLLLLNMMDNQIIELVIEQEIENERTLNRGQRKNLQKYIASYQKDQYVLLLSSSSEILYLFDFETLLVRECPRGVNSRSILEIDLAHKKVVGEQPGGIDLESYIDYVINR